MFCSHCGETLPENAFFCLKCGVMTGNGVEAGVAYPWNWEKEMEKTLSTAAREVEKVFNNIRTSVRGSIKREQVICSNCGEKNVYGSKFCYKCGKGLDKK